ncbi:magnesium-translocating P-type ATPase [Zoogloea sp.]|uniref:magnesium-translocating P-type ATPase n=1 Tax=Zoogloea sp. TaxID=49181 RepID=UPI0025D139BB|nr:magnesium-translocating P-type ATPase [Zoogloea sp.]MCK6395276.1 magnesium-translocating P-type ATPase [Zoogloea sp.]
MKLSPLHAHFVAHLHRRRTARLFLRHFSFEAFRHAPVSKGVPVDLAHTLTAAAGEAPDALLARLHSHPDGLDARQAARIRQHSGANLVQHEQPMPAWLHLWHCYIDPFNLLLSALAAMSWYSGDVKATTVIGCMVVLSTLIRFVQERRSSHAADALKAMVGSRATVLRRETAGEADDPATRHVVVDGRNVRCVEVPLAELVPGDIVVLSAGDMIPADLRLLKARDLYVGQGAMTGESLPVEKFAALRGPAPASPLDLDSIAFMGTNVLSGSATGVVIATGARSYFGTLAARVTAVDRAPTAFQAGVNKVSWLLIRFMAVMTPLVFLINGFTKGDWVDAFLFAMSVAIGLTPEMLPMVVTSTLAKGAVLLSRRKVIVKRLDAIQNFGAMDVLCTDKTGTLTQDHIVLQRHVDIDGRDSLDVLKYAWLNSHYQTGLKNLLDVAVLARGDELQPLDLPASFLKVDEIPFDFQRRRMSVVVADRREGHLLICKGAIEEILAACTSVRRGEVVAPLDGEALAHIRQLTDAMNGDGLRVVGVATRALPANQSSYGVADEAGLTLAGYIAFLDPPKDSAAPALLALRDKGVTVKVLTGDNGLVTARVCHEVGLAVAGLLQGAEVSAMDDAALGKAVETTTVFAKLSPLDKERVVRALRGNGHVVGFMGDGINDAPALHAADIGISVDTAVDIAKEAADIILLEKSLLVLADGVREGRKTFANMLKYIRMTASSNFGNVFSVLVASVFLPFLPMLPMHLLLQNLLYDISQTGIPFDNVDEEFLNRPQHWNADGLGRFMMCFGPVSSIFDLATFALMWFVFHATTPAAQTLFQSGWFIEGLLSQTLVVHLIRTRKLPFVDSRASLPLTAMTAAVVLTGVTIVMGPLAAYFKLQALPLAYFGWLAAILLAYMGLTQGMKNWYGRRFGWQ